MTNINESLKQNTGICFLFLFEILHSSLAEPYRIVNNTEDIIYNTNTYKARSFEVVLPNINKKAPETQIVIDNTDREIYRIINSIDSTATINLYLISVNMLGEVTTEIPALNFDIKSSNFDKRNATLYLMFENILNEIWPKDNMNPNDFPGLFA
jgi:hypothetical protein